MTNQTRQPGPGQSTSYAAFTALKNEIAQRYAQAEKEALKPPAAREQEQVRRPRQENPR